VTKRIGRTRRLLHAALIAALAAGLPGCGVSVDVPKEPPTTAQIKGWSHQRVTDLEKAIREKDWRLPSRARDLARYLRGFELNLTVGPGQEFQNTEEAVGALETVATTLDDWYHESLGRREGDSDEDRARLQAIVDEIKEVLRKLNVDKPKSP